MKSLKFNPVIREGLFRVTYKQHSGLYSAVDIADAKYQLIEDLALFPECKTIEQLVAQKAMREDILSSIKVLQLRKTLRESNRKDAKRRANKMNMTSG
jgi:hypothetical protein